jgi:hypothetical protein
MKHAAEQPDKVGELRAKLDALMSTSVASGTLADTTDDKPKQGKKKGKKQ